VQIDIQARGFQLTDALRNHAEVRLRFAFTAVGARVMRVGMRLADVNGPRGGVDKRCTIRASVPGAPAVVIDQRDVDLYAAIDRAANRAGRALARRLDRLGTIRRSALRFERVSDDSEPGER